jgi:hypothetical protein
VRRHRAARPESGDIGSSSHASGLDRSPITITHSFESAQCDPAFRFDSCGRSGANASKELS